MGPLLPVHGQRRHRFHPLLFPGAAHNEYWHDPGVFGHFIQKVVDPPDQQGGPVVLKPSRGARFEKPRGSTLAWLVSYPMPYVLAAGLLFLACYLIYKAVRGCLDPIGSRFESPGEVLLNVGALWGLIAGTSLLARIPRLSWRSPKWRHSAFPFALIPLLYVVLVDEKNKESIEQFLNRQADVGLGFHVFNGLVLGGVALAWLFLGKVEAAEARRPDDPPGGAVRRRLAVREPGRGHGPFSARGLLLVINGGGPARLGGRAGHLSDRAVQPPAPGRSRWCTAAGW